MSDSPRYTLTNVRADVRRLVNDLLVQVGAPCHVPDCAQCERHREDLFLLVHAGFRIGREWAFAHIEQLPADGVDGLHVGTDLITRAIRDAGKVEPAEVLSRG